MRLISALPCTDYGQHCIVIYLSFIVITKQIIAKKNLKCLEQANEGDQDLIQLCLKIDSILSLFHLAWDIFVIHWCCTSWQGKKQKKSCALRTQSQRCHRTCCVIKYVFILGLQYWTNWTKNKMKSTNFTRDETRGLIPTLRLLQVYKK